MTPRQGEIWWAESEDARRPVLVITRDDVIDVLNRIIVAPVTRTVRDIPTEIRLGIDHGLSVDCVASFDNLQPISRSFLTERVGRLRVDQTDEICRVLGALADC